LLPLLPLTFDTDSCVTPRIFMSAFPGTVAAAASSLLSSIQHNVPCFGGVQVPKDFISSVLDLVVRMDGGGAVKRRLQQQLQVGLHHMDHYVTIHVDHPTALSCLTPAPGCLAVLPPTFVLAISPCDGGGEWIRACALSCAPPPLTASCFLCTSTLQQQAMSAPLYEQSLAPLAAFPPDGMFNGPCIPDSTIRLFLANSPPTVSFRHWQPPAVYTAASQLLKPMLDMDASM
jgi:hypothetical protein